nr:hypothetical protein [Tanacetum cinerariifolium]
MLHDPTAVTVAVRIVPHHTMYPPVAGVASLAEPNLGGRAADRLNTRDKTRNLSLKEITDTKGPVPIRFEVCDKQALMPYCEHAAHWSSYIEEVIRGVPLYHPSWLKVPKERKAVLIADIGRQSSATREYPSPIDTFFVAHTVNGEFLLDEDRRIYFESGGASGSGVCGDDEESADDDEDGDGDS